jgi:hypothetical protein
MPERVVKVQEGVVTTASWCRHGVQKRVAVVQEEGA